MNKRSVACRSQRGSILVLAAGLLFALTGFAVLAFDVGRIFIVRNEMQNAADSAALAGANCLTRQSDAGSSVECISALSEALNWTRASAKAAGQLSRNSADGAPISSAGAGQQIQVGYWNLLTGTPSGGSFATGFSPLTLYDRPAVSVTITKAAGVNNGPITMLSRLIYGAGADVPMTAKAVAVISSPRTVPPGAAIPQAINKCMYDRFWDAATGTPAIYTGNPPDPFGISTVGQPWRVRIGSAYHYGTCDSGQWTTFDRPQDSQAAVGALIADGNPLSIAIGDMTWIQPGTKTASYDDLDAKYPTPPGKDVTFDVTVVVVDTADLSKKGKRPVVAFAGFRIDNIEGGSGKYIQGRFISSSVTAGAGGIGPFYGTYNPPRLAQ